MNLQPLISKVESINQKLAEMSNQSLPWGADYFIQSNADAGGNYQTITYKKGGSSGTVVKVITLTFDGSGNVLTFSES